MAAWDESRRRGWTYRPTLHTIAVGAGFATVIALACMGGRDVLAALLIVAALAELTVGQQRKVFSGSSVRSAAVPAAKRSGQGHTFPGSALSADMKERR